MEKWEYRSVFLWAHEDNKAGQEFVRKTWPTWKPAKYSPEFMIADLNEYGENGWELVHMQPVAAGKNCDVMLGYGNHAGEWWSNAYFCVFKRRKPE